MANLIGQSLGRYTILEQLGEGGMAVVYKAFDTRLERNVAIKVILPSKEHSDKFLKRFEREAKALAGLSHPNIVKVIDYGEHEGLPYLVMEYLPGGILKQRMLGKPMPWQDAVRMLIPVARALSYAHASRIIHRDIKPSNILITQSGEPMLSDFGIAKILESEETMELTGTGVGIGTPEYMSPEQAQGKLVDARSDIYSLGVVLYEMVTGRKPYQADTPYAVVIKQVNEPLPRPTGFVSDLPDDLERILLKSLAKDPANRYQDMLQLIDALEQMGSQKNSQRAKVDVRLPKIPVRAIVDIAILGIVTIATLWAYQNGWINRLLSGITKPSPTSSDAVSSEPAGYLMTRGTGWSDDLTIVYMKPDGSEFIPLVNLEGTNRVPSLSPDGKRIAFISDNDGDNDIYIFDIETKNTNKLMDTPTTEWNPAWSPDGDRLAFVSDFAGSFDVYIISAIGTGMRQLTQDPLPEWVPSWEPEGNRIVFQRGDETSSQSDLYILDAVSGDVIQLTNDRAFDGYPSWSPLGDKIAFASNLDGNLDIYVISPDGSGRNIASANQNNESTPAWSPTGEQLVFSMDLGGSNNDLFLVNVDGTGLTRLTTSPENETEPVWVRDASLFAALNASSSNQTAVPESGAATNLVPSDDISLYDDFDNPVESTLFWGVPFWGNPVPDLPVQADGLLTFTINGQWVDWAVKKPGDIKQIYASMELVSRANGAFGFTVRNGNADFYAYIMKPNGLFIWDPAGMEHFQPVYPCCSGKHLLGIRSDEKKIFLTFDNAVVGEYDMLGYPEVATIQIVGSGKSIGVVDTVWIEFAP